MPSKQEDNLINLRIFIYVVFLFHYYLVAESICLIENFIFFFLLDQVLTNCLFYRFFLFFGVLVSRKLIDKQSFSFFFSI